MMADQQKPVSVSEITVDRILSQYLWNTPTPPRKENMAAAVTLAERTSVKIDAVDYMKNGAGRYASAADFKMFENFFKAANLPTRVQPYSFEEVVDLIYKDIENAQDVKKLPNSKKGFTASISQYGINPSSADYVERAFIFGSTQVTVTPADLKKLQFIVNPDGSKEIRNLRITPVKDNFDFDGGGSGSDLSARIQKMVVDGFNSVFQKVIDPNNIGKTVPIEYVDLDKLPYVNITDKEFQKLQMEKSTQTIEEVIIEEKGLPFLEAAGELLIKLLNSSVLYNNYWADVWSRWETAPTFGQAAQTISPIIIDLDGDGVETVGRGQKHIHFDLDNNGFAEQAGWAGRDDGLLALDLNRNGKIDNGGELFGNHTLLVNGQKAANGFEALKQYDANGNGLLDAGDKRWGDFRIWQDADSDGLTDNGELKSLADIGITSVSLKYREGKTVDVNGNAHKQIASATWANGKSTTATDVWFQADTARTVYAKKIIHPAEISKLPEVRAFGNVYSLRDAMSQNKALLGAVKDYLVNPTEEKLYGFIYQWAGVEKTAAGSRGQYIDARKLAVLESLVGEGFYQTYSDIGRNPAQNAGSILEKEFAKFAAYVAGSIQIQQIYFDTFGRNMVESDDASSVRVDWESMWRHVFQLILNKDVLSSEKIALVIEDALIYNPSVAVEFKRATSKFVGMVFNYNSIGMADFKLLAELEGTAGNVQNNVIEAPKTRSILLDGAVLFGDTGNDRLYGQEQNDILIGGADNDALYGRAGSDIYIFGKNFGRDVIFDGSNEDMNMNVIRFTEGWMPADFTFSRSEYNKDLYIHASKGSQRIIIDKYFASETSGNPYIFEFDNGQKLDFDTVKKLVQQGTDGNDSLWAYSGGNKLYGLGGNDYLHGHADNDSLDGGIGRDFI